VEYISIEFIDPKGWIIDPKSWIIDPKGWTLRSSG
jgi:hypothetical protein